jgi:hypothetical protein
MSWNPFASMFSKLPPILPQVAHPWIVWPVLILALWIGVATVNVLIMENRGQRPVSDKTRRQWHAYLRKNGRQNEIGGDGEQDPDVVYESTATRERQQQAAAKDVKKDN